MAIVDDVPGKRPSCATPVVPCGHGPMAPAWCGAEPAAFRAVWNRDGVKGGHDRRRAEACDSPAAAWRRRVVIHHASRERGHRREATGTTIDRARCGADRHGGPRRCERTIARPRELGGHGGLRSRGSRKRRRTGLVRWLRPARRRARLAPVWRGAGRKTLCWVRGLPGAAEAACNAWVMSPRCGPVERAGTGAGGGSRRS